MMRNMPARIPKLPVTPGDYAVEWFFDERAIPGELHLEPDRPPQAELFGDAVLRDWSRGGVFPQDDSFDRVVGRLRSNLDVVLGDAHISVWLPERSLGSARHAVVGLDVAGVPDDAFHRARFQVTNLDLLFGVAPIKSVAWPTGGTPRLAGRYAIETNPEAHREWVDDGAGITIECTYDIQVPIGSGHQHHVAFAPIISIASDEPLTVGRWIDEWITPILRLTSLATRHPQRLSWLTVNTAPRSDAGDESRRSTTGTVFGSGIQQTPYEAEYRDEWREPENRPLFSLASIPMPLPDLVRRWRELERDQNPFIELFGLTLRQTQLPARARYLYLVQALESLHAYEHRISDLEEQAAYQERRFQTIEELASLEISSKSLRFIKGKWSKRRPDSLDRRLRALLEQLPGRVRGLVSALPDGDVLANMTADQPQPLEVLLRALRNDLSHGNRNYDDRSLRPWVWIAETMCRAHALRLLEFDDEAVADGLVPPPAPERPAHGADEAAQT